MKKGFLFICLLVISSMIFSMSASAFGPVQRGDFGADVAEVQQMLINIGYLNDNADGEFGPMTQGAVMAFQSDYGLDVDGMVDDQTYDTLVWASGGVPYETGTWYYNEYNGWWYMYDDGTYPVSCWAEIDGWRYHFDSWGYMDTGWLWDDDWYYLYPNGVMATGWIWDGDWYFFASNGVMIKGWFLDGDDWYYFDADGVMVTGTWKIDGVEYEFDDDGRMISGGSSSSDQLVSDTYSATCTDYYGRTYSYYIPQINIDGYDAYQVNQQLFSKYYGMIQESIAQAESGGSLSVVYTSLSYWWYVNYGILSLVININGIDAYDNFEVYNFSLSDGSRLYNSSVYGFFGLSNYDYYNLVSGSIEREYESMGPDGWNISEPFSEKDIENSIADIINSYAYIGENGALYVLTKIFISGAQNWGRWGWFSYDL